MNKEIESVIFSNVGNRLTEELAMGLVMSIMQIAQKLAEAAHTQGAASATAMLPSVAAAAGPDQAGVIDPAYARKQPSSARPRRQAATRKPTKARQ